MLIVEGQIANLNAKLGQNQTLMVSKFPGDVDGDQLHNNNQLVDPKVSMKYLLLLGYGCLRACFSTIDELLKM